MRPACGPVCFAVHLHQPNLRFLAIRMLNRPYNSYDRMLAPLDLHTASLEPAGTSFGAQRPEELYDVVLDVVQYVVRFITDCVT